MQEDSDTRYVETSAVCARQVQKHKCLKVNKQDRVSFSIFQTYRQEQSQKWWIDDHASTIGPVISGVSYPPVGAELDSGKTIVRQQFEVKGDT